MEVKELGHVVLFVSDIEQSRRFYTDVLGFREVRREGRRPNTAVYSTGRTHHELYLMQVGDDAQPIPQGPRLGLYHIGIKIGHDRRGAAGRARRTAMRPECASLGTTTTATPTASTSSTPTATRSNSTSTSSPKPGVRSSPAKRPSAPPSGSARRA